MSIKKWREFKYLFNPLLPRQLPPNFLYERFVSVKDHRKKEIRRNHIRISPEEISITTTTQLYEAGSVYDKINITHTAVKEEKHVPDSQAIMSFWKTLRKNKASDFPSPDVHNSHDGMTDQISSNTRISFSFYKNGRHRQFDIFDGHDCGQGDPWLSRLENIIDAEEKIALHEPKEKIS